MTPAGTSTDLTSRINGITTHTHTHTHKMVNRYLSCNMHVGVGVCFRPIHSGHQVVGMYGHHILLVVETVI